jgi:V8-like Glu-specific endopeptidase
MKFFTTHNSEQVHANASLRVRRREVQASKAAAPPAEGAVILEVALNDPRVVSVKDSRSSNNTVTEHIYKESAAPHAEDNGKGKGGFNPNTLPPKDTSLLPPDKASGGQYSTKYAFGSDDRFVIRDTSYPYSTVGKVQSAEGSCTGTMVGRRLMLTAKHCVSDGYMKFTPSYYDSSEPFGSAYATDFLYW